MKDLEEAIQQSNDDWSVEPYDRSERVTAFIDFCNNGFDAHDFKQEKINVDGQLVFVKNLTVRQVARYLYDISMNGMYDHEYEGIADTAGASVSEFQSEQRRKKRFGIAGGLFVFTCVASSIAFMGSGISALAFESVANSNIAVLSISAALVSLLSCIGLYSLANKRQTNQKIIYSFVSNKIEWVKSFHTSANNNSGFGDTKFSDYIHVNVSAENNPVIENTLQEIFEKVNPSTTPDSNNEIASNSDYEPAWNTSNSADTSSKRSV